MLNVFFTLSNLVNCIYLVAQIRKKVIASQWRNWFCTYIYFRSALSLVSEVTLWTIELSNFLAFDLFKSVRTSFKPFHADHIVIKHIHGTLLAWHDFWHLWLMRVHINNWLLLLLPYFLRIFYPQLLKPIYLTPILHPILPLSLHY